MLDSRAPLLYSGVMLKCPSKRRGLNQMAVVIVVQSVSDEAASDPYQGKNTAAVELRRLRGRKGGRARADALSKEQRSGIAQRAAQARWHAE